MGISEYSRPNLYNGAYWHSYKDHWQVTVTVFGKQFLVETFHDSRREEAGRMADAARWYLQDFLTKKPRYNFPDDLPPGPPTRRIVEIRQKCFEVGFPRYTNYDSRFDPLDPRLNPGSRVDRAKRIQDLEIAFGTVLEECPLPEGPLPDWWLKAYEVLHQEPHFSLQKSPPPAPEPESEEGRAGAPAAELEEVQS